MDWRLSNYKNQCSRGAKVQRVLFSQSLFPDEDYVARVMPIWKRTIDTWRYHVERKGGDKSYWAGKLRRAAHDEFIDTSLAVVILYYCPLSVPLFCHK